MFSLCVVMVVSFSYCALLSRNFIIIGSNISCPSDLTDVKYWIVIILIAVH